MDKTRPTLHEIKKSGKATLSVEETASLLEISLGSARKAVRAGEIPALRLGARWLVPVPRLLQMLGDEVGEVPKAARLDGDE